MDPTVEQIKAQARALLDDTSTPARYDADSQTVGFNEAWHILNQSLQWMQGPKLKKVTAGITIAAGTTEYNPQTGSVEFGELILLEERPNGTTERFKRLDERDELLQRDQGTFLGEFVWREDKFYFVGATQDVELRMTYYQSGTPPTTGAVGIDGSFLVLSKLMAACMGPRKGQDDLAQSYRIQVLGPRFDDGVVGGTMRLLLLPMIRAKQRVPRAPRPFRAGYTLLDQRRRSFQIGQAASSGGVMVPGTVVGTIDGVNAVFTLTPVPNPTNSWILRRNGVVQERGVDLDQTGPAEVTFIAGHIPQPGDILAVDVGS